MWVLLAAGALQDGVTFSPPLPPKSLLAPSNGCTLPSASMAGFLSQLHAWLLAVFMAPSYLNREKQLNSANYLELYLELSCRQEQGLQGMGSMCVPLPVS